MIDWEHQLMEVRKSGRIEQRRISHVSDASDLLPSGRGMPLPQPVLQPGEIIRWVIGSDVPDIFDGPL